MKACFFFAASFLALIPSSQAAEEKEKPVLLASDENAIESGQRRIYDVDIPKGAKAIKFSYLCMTQSMSNHSPNSVSIDLLNAKGETVRSVTDTFGSETTWGTAKGSMHEKRMEFGSLPPGKYQLKLYVYGGDYKNSVRKFEAYALSGG